MYNLLKEKEHVCHDILNLFGPAKKDRKCNCRYFSVIAKYGDEAVRIFFIKYGRNKNWNIIITRGGQWSMVNGGLFLCVHKNTHKTSFIKSFSNKNY